MKDILFGMAVGGVLGMLLYKNSTCAKEIFDKGEEMVMQEIEKYDQMAQKKPSNKSQSGKKN